MDENDRFCAKSADVENSVQKLCRLHNIQSLFFCQTTKANFFLWVNKIYLSKIYFQNRKNNQKK